MKHETPAAPRPTWESGVPFTDAEMVVLDTFNATHSAWCDALRAAACLGTRASREKREAAWADFVRARRAWAQLLRTHALPLFAAAVAR